MTTLNINEAQIREQEEILAAYLQARFPEQDFSPGTAIRNSAIRMSVYAFGILKAMIEQQVLPRQSLLNLENASPSEEVDILVDQIMSNWFLTRKTGQYARGVVLVHLSRRADITIPTTTEFIKNGKTFIINQDTDFTKSGTQLTAIYGSDEVITGYTARVPLIASEQGLDGEISAGIFDTWSQFSPYVTKVEAEAKFTYGLDVESSSALIKRAPSAIAERSLVIKKGIIATLTDGFSQTPEIVAVGAGDPEMMRDLITLPTGDQLHVLGHVNIYAPFPVLPNQIVELEVGDFYGDPADESIAEVEEKHTVVLPAIPFMRIIQVKDLSDDTIFERTNTTPTEDGYYTIEDVRPTDAFSSKQYRKLKLYLESDALNVRDGHILSITYDTAEGFAEVDEYIQNELHRNLSANMAVVAQYPIWLSFTLVYSYLETASETLDTDLAKNFIADYVNAFAANESISMNSIATQFKLGFISILNSIAPFTISYQLECPDGRIIDFSTTDKVSMSADKLVTAGDITDFLALQLSDRTVRYLTAPDMITLEQASV